MRKDYVSTMMQNQSLLRTIVLAAVLAALMAGFGASADLARAADRETDGDRYSIMAPERRLTTRQKARALPMKPQVARPQPPQPLSVRPAKPAPPVVLRSGRVVPNLPPSNRGVVPDGRRETSGDRVSRCAHQAGLHGVPLDQRHTYMHACTQ